jgi:5-methylcytosine-specific restriction endonuclease McrA
VPRTPHLCSVPFCPNVVEDGPGRCEQHRPSGWTEYKRAGRSDRYDDPAWKRLRARHIRVHPTCARCGNPAEHVHHRDRDPARFLDPTNLESLCADCHASETGRQGALVKQGSA